MGSVLRSGRWLVTQSVESLGNIAGHGDVNVASVVIPVDFETEVTGSGPVDGEAIPGGKGRKEVIGVCLGEVFDAEVVHCKGESGRTGGVAPKTWGVTDGVVAVGSEMSLELVIGEDCGFLEAVHTLVDFDVNVASGVEMGVGQVVLINHLLGDILAVDAHVLVDEHVGDEEEIFEVASAVASTEMGIGDNTVEVEFGVDDTDGRGADILVSVEAVATDSHAEAVDFGFAGAHSTDKVGIGDFAAGWYLVWKNEYHGAVSSDLLADWSRFLETLGAATPLVRERPCPDERVETSEE